MAHFYPDGLSNHANAHSILNGPIWTSGAVIFVSSANGDASNSGLSPNQPIATLAAATVGTGLLVVLMDGHEETISSQKTISSAGTIIGETSSGGSPTVKLTPAVTSSYVFSSGPLNLVNLHFKAQSAANSSSTLQILSRQGMVQDCVLEDNSNHNDPSFEIDDDWPMLVRCTLKSVATSVATRPATGIDVGASTPTGDHSYFEDCTFDDGEYGRTGDSFGPIATRDHLQMQGLSLLNGAVGDFNYDHNCSGYVGVGAATRGGHLKTSGETVVLPGSTPLRNDLYVSVSDTDKVIYIDSANGDDTETSPYDEDRPLATLAAAAAFITAGGFDDMILVLADNHTETITTTIDLDQDGTIVLGGKNCTLTVGADTNGLDISGVSVHVKNIAFETSAQLGASSFIATVTAAATHFHDCTFECSADITNAALNYTNSATYIDLKNCTFTATGTSLDDRPSKALLGANAGYEILRNVTFDGGTYGFSGYAYSNTGGTCIRGQLVTAKNGADINIQSNNGYLRADVDETCTVRAFL